jgi:hypothetical protein
MRSRINGKQRSVPMPRRTKIIGKTNPKGSHVPSMDIDNMPVGARGSERPSGSAAPGQPGL